MRTVYKYELEIADEQFVVMPTGAELLTVQVQAGTGMVCLWARVDTDAPVVRRRIWMRGTGYPDAYDVYVATFQYHFGLVFHVFDGGEQA